MRKWLIVLVGILSLSLVGCQNNEVNVKPEGDKESYLVELAQYQGAYVGDAVAVGEILNRLWGSDVRDGLLLQTKDEPYGIETYYKLSNQEQVDLWASANLQQQFEDNAIVLFSLIQNVGYVDFVVDSTEVEKYHFERAALEDEYGVDFSVLADDLEQWEEILNQ